ncbi:MAG: CBS domain-containing protein [Gallionellaceae bacterium]|jgi:signal-transduction protein with cAMP-binding, CBS, and nucleotidyltransferase domain
MPISSICNRNVITVPFDSSVLQAAQLMREHHVGDVIVVEERLGVRVPIGIVTDRDLVMEVMATELNSATLTVGDIMTPELVFMKESSGIFEAIEFMRAKCVRRMPVVDDNNALVGILTTDDLLELLAEELLTLSRLVRDEQNKEIMNRP